MGPHRREDPQAECEAELLAPESVAPVRWAGASISTVAMVAVGICEPIGSGGTETGVDRSGI